MIKNILKNIFRKHHTAIDDFTYSLLSEISGFKTVIDVGAYHGDFIAKIIKANPKVSLHAFEPYKKSFDYIINRFNGMAGLQINHAAVSDIAGTSVLNVNAFTETNSLLDRELVDESIDSLTKLESSETVALINLDEYCKQNDITFIDLIKIDTQGNSYQVLKGLDTMLSHQNIKYLYVEAEFTEIYKNEKLFSEIELLMRVYGYYIVRLYNINYINNKQLGWCDILFTTKKHQNGVN